MLLLLAPPVLAQEGTPGPESETGRRRTGPYECTIAPRSVTSVTTILGLDAGGVSAPPPMTITAPLGQPVDPGTYRHITQVVRGILACVDAGDLPRTTAWMTEHGIQRVYWRLTVDAVAREAARTRLTGAPQPLDWEAWFRLIAITDASFLPDRRVAAFAVINDPASVPGGPETVLLVFTDDGGAWRLDDWVDFSLMPPLASLPTPAA